MEIKLQNYKKKTNKNNPNKSIFKNILILKK